MMINNDNMLTTTEENNKERQTTTMTTKKKMYKQQSHSTLETVEREDMTSMIRCRSGGVLGGDVRDFW
jgi:hypothetical protein